MNNAELHGGPAHGWTCFHCGETFTTVGGAADHFGADQTKTPGCLIRVQLGDERGLLMEVRKLEAENARLRNDIEGEISLNAALDARLLSQFQNYKPFRECKSVWEIFCVYDSKEGEAIVADELRAEVELLRARLAEIESA